MPAYGGIFWSRHPALFAGFCLFIGASCSLQPLSISDLWALPLLLFIIPPRRLFAAFLLIAVAAVTTSVRVRTPACSFQHFGTLYGEVMDRHVATLHGRTLWRVQVAVDSFRSSDGQVVLRGRSLSLTSPSPCLFRGGALYRFSAHVCVDDQGRVRLRPFFAKGVEEVSRRFSLVEWRVSMRQRLEARFAALFPDPSIRSIAGALTFGLYKDPLFQKAMHRAGVEHVLAVSGFHFGIVAALTVFLAQRLAPRRRSIVAMVFLTLYLALIGPLPSVVRAWTASMVVLWGLCQKRFPSGLNCLGVGLTASVLYDPASVAGIGYHLSYLATAAILFFSRPTLTLLRTFITSRSVDDVLALSKSDQVLLFVLELFLPALSLLIPVFLVICPYQLAFLQDFSLLGPIYNLLIPALFSLAMPMILLAVLIPVPWVSVPLAFLGSIPLYLGRILVERVPEASWGLVPGGVVPRGVGLFLLLSIFLVGMTLKSRADEERADAWKACL